MKASDWRGLIARIVAEEWPELPDGRLWIEAQINAESGGDPKAQSQVGACGLMQLMPATWRYLNVRDPFNPEESIRAGSVYLKEQYDHFPEIPWHFDRLCSSFASYNCGRGYVNAALKLAREDGGVAWHTWPMVAQYLADPRCVLHGKHPDAKQTTEYVRRIVRYVTDHSLDK